MRVAVAIAAILAVSSVYAAHAGDAKPKYCPPKTGKTGKPAYPSSPVPVSTTSGVSNTNTDSNSNTNQNTNNNLAASRANSSSASSAKSASNSHSASNSASNATGGAATSNATGGAGGAGGNGFSSSNAAGGSANGQNSTSIASSYQEVRQTPPAFSGSVQPTASCKNAINGGASAPVAGLSFGFGKGDAECDKRETAREFHEMGRPDLAIAMLCSTKAAQGLPGCQPAEPPVAAPAERTYTKAEVDLIVRKAVGK